MTAAAQPAPAGVWAAVTNPFDAQGRIDLDVFSENVRRLARAGVHGIYTTDSDGEFYALEQAEFCDLVDAFADETQAFGVPAHCGVTWCNTDGMLARLRHCAERGINGAHVGHPFFMPMTAASYDAFWRDVARAVPAEFELVHYNTPRVHNTQCGRDYARLVSFVPGLCATKHVGQDVVAFGELVREAPMLSHLVVDETYGYFAPYGAAGVCSWFANFNPKFMIEWHADAVAGNWESVFARQRRMLEFTAAAAMLEADGSLHGIVGKAISQASDFLVPTAHTRRPYLPVRPELVERWRELVVERFDDLRWRPPEAVPSHC
jgi:4-hydroxy-tetrahydrodipicolinate synthase